MVDNLHRTRAIPGIITDLNGRVAEHGVTIIPPTREILNPTTPDFGMILQLLSQKADKDELARYLAVTEVDELPEVSERIDKTLYVVGSVGYVWIGGQLIGLGGGGSTGGSAELTESITATGVSVGNITEGTTLEAGMELTDILKEMLVKRIAAVYSAPTLSLAAAGATYGECGTAVSAVLTPAFSQNDAGALLSYALTKDGTSILTAIGAYTDAIVLSETAIRYQATATYADGAVKNDNLGDPSPAGAIAAGSVSSSVRSYQGFRRAFYGVGLVPTTSAAVRALSSSTNAPTNGTSMTTSGASGSRMVWCYPATIQNPTKCTMVSSGFSFDITNLLVAQTRVAVADAAGANPVDYKVFSYTPAVAFTAANFTLVL